MMETKLGKVGFINPDYVKLLSQPNLYDDGTKLTHVKL